MRLFTLRGIRYPAVGFALLGGPALFAVLGRHGQLPLATAWEAGVYGAVAGFVIFLNVRRDEGRGSYDDPDRSPLRIGPGPGGRLVSRRPSPESAQALLTYLRHSQSALKGLREPSVDGRRATDATVARCTLLEGESKWAAQELGIVGRLLA